MTDLEQRIEDWTGATGATVEPVTADEVLGMARRGPRRHPTRRLLVGTVSLLFVALAVGVVLRAQDRSTVVRTDPPAGHVGQGGPTATSQGVDDYNIDAFLAELVAHGAHVRRLPAGTYPGPMVLGVSPTEVCVNSRIVRVFEYDTARERQAQSTLISDDGSQVPSEGGATAIVEWIGPPQFFARGRITVLYIGPIGDLTQRLETLLGPTLSPDAVAGRGEGGIFTTHDC